MFFSVTMLFLLPNELLGRVHLELVVVALGCLELLLLLLLPRALNHAVLGRVGRLAAEGSRPEAIAGLERKVKCGEDALSRDQ